VKARRLVVHVTPSWMSHKDQVEDGQVHATDCVRPYHHYFVVFIVLGHRSILII
jgi:hypothetical protein